MPKPNSENRCQQINAHGRQCRSLRGADHPSLCSYHALQEQRNVALAFKPADPALALDLLGPIHDFRTAASINHVLGNLVVLLAADRIPTRNAAVLAYACQLLLQSLREVKSELWDLKDSPEMQKALKQILKAPSPGTAASKFVDDVCKFTLSKGRTEGPALVKSNGSATT
jgi:hypothetical protein